MGKETRREYDGNEDLDTLIQIDEDVKLTDTITGGLLFD